METERTGRPGDGVGASSSGFGECSAMPGRSVGVLVCASVRGASVRYVVPGGCANIWTAEGVAFVRARRKLGFRYRRTNGRGIERWQLISVGRCCSCVFAYGWLVIFKDRMESVEDDEVRV